MPAPKGNKYLVGNKGGGRKSAYAEIADANMLWNVFIDKLSLDEVSKRLKGKHSIKDVWITKAYEGNESFIRQIVQKLFPDKQEVEHSGSISLKEILSGINDRKDR